MRKITELVLATDYPFPKGIKRKVTEFEMYREGDSVVIKTGDGTLELPWTGVTYAVFEDTTDGRKQGKKDSSRATKAKRKSRKARPEAPAVRTSEGLRSGRKPTKSRGVHAKSRKDVRSDGADVQRSDEHPQVSDTVHRKD